MKLKKRVALLERSLSTIVEEHHRRLDILERDTHITSPPRAGNHIAPPDEKKGLDLLFDKPTKYRHVCKQCKIARQNYNASAICTRCNTPMITTTVKPYGAKWGKGQPRPARRNGNP
jgi:hypothetical protein